MQLTGYNQDVLKNYMEQEILTNHPIKNTIIIYEKCISKFRLVGRLFEQLKFREADEQSEKLEKVFFELKMQIDEKADEALAEELHDLYNWILREIHDMRAFRRVGNIATIEVVLNDLIDGYEGILKKDAQM